MYRQNSEKALLGGGGGEPPPPAPPLATLVNINHDFHEMELTWLSRGNSLQGLRGNYGMHVAVTGVYVTTFQ